MDDERAAAGELAPDDAAPDGETTPEDVEDIDAREAARIHRRDHDAEAHRRELLRPGMGKVFKQITDSWAKEALPDHDRVRKGAPKDHDRPQ